MKTKDITKPLKIIKIPHFPKPLTDSKGLLGNKYIPPSVLNVLINSHMTDSKVFNTFNTVPLQPLKKHPQDVTFTQQKSSPTTNIHLEGYTMKEIGYIIVNTVIGGVLIGILSASLLLVLGTITHVKEFYHNQEMGDFTFLLAVGLTVLLAYIGCAMILLG